MITPIDNQKASQFSEARVTFDDDFFYVAIIFFNNSVRKICSRIFKRDFSFNKNDNFPFSNRSIQ